MLSDTGGEVRLGCMVITVLYGETVGGLPSPELFCVLTVLNKKDAVSVIAAGHQTVSCQPYLTSVLYIHR